MSGRRLGERVRGGAAAFRGSWHNPALRRAQLCFAGAWTAEWAFTVGLGVLAFERGGAAAVGAVSLLRMLPAAFVTPFASVYGDRWRRERILLVVTGGRGVALGLMAVLAWLDAAVAVIYALAVVATIAGVLFRPVHSALVPSLCRTPTELTGANVVRGMLDSLSTLLGPLLAAVLLAVSGPGAVFAACAVASLWAAWLIAGVMPEVMATGEADATAEPAAAPASVVADLVEGLRVIGRDRHLTVLVVLAEVQTLMRGALTVFSVVVAIDLLDMGESGVGTLNAAVGTGAVLGSLAVSLLVGNHRLARWFGAGVALWGLPMALIGVIPVREVALFLLLFIGVGNALVDVGIFTLVARLTPTTMVARVFGAMEGVGALTVGVGAALTPVAIHLLGMRGALVAIGLVSPVLVAVSWASLRRLDGSIERRDHEVDLLHAVPMLAGLPLPAVGELAVALEPVTVPPGQVVFAQGDLGDRCYFVESGSAVVIGDGKEVTELGAGEMFGEIALLRQVPRTATVRAGSELHLQALRSEAFLPVVTGYRSSAGRATADVDAQLDRFAPRGSRPDDSQDV
ncbi:MAG TPA: MFS transporter [Actinomycetes bacterium]|nr:MFS transporter [Actinomycetes bacterium]